MTQPELNFNPLPRPAALWPSDCQDRRLLERLIEGPVSNAQMRDDLRLLSYTRRLSDLREKLEPLGWTVKKEHQGNGVFIYTLKSAPPRERTTASSIASGEIALVGAV